VDKEFPLVKVKVFHRTRLLSREFYLSRMKCVIQTRESSSYQEFRVSDICHGGIDHYFCYSVACGEVTQGNIFKDKGALAAALTIKQLPVAKQEVQGGLC